MLDWKCAHGAVHVPFPANLTHLGNRASNNNPCNQLQACPSSGSNTDTVPLCIAIIFRLSHASYLPHPMS